MDKIRSGLVDYGMVDCVKLISYATLMSTTMIRRVFASICGSVASLIHRRVRYVQQLIGAQTKGIYAVVQCSFYLFGDACWIGYIIYITYRVYLVELLPIGGSYEE